MGYPNTDELEDDGDGRDDDEVVAAVGAVGARAEAGPVSLPPEVLPGWRGRPVDVLVAVEWDDGLPAVPLVLEAVVAWAEPDVSQPRAELVDATPGWLGLITTYEALAETYEDGLAAFSTPEGLGVWVVACRR